MRSPVTSSSTSAARMPRRHARGWIATLLGPREWLSELAVGEGRLPSWPSAVLWMAAAGAGLGALADRWIPWHMGVWATAWPIGLVAALAALHWTVLRPMGGRATFPQMLAVWGLVSVPAGALLALNLWAALHPPL